MGTSQTKAKRKYNAKTYKRFGIFLPLSVAEEYEKLCDTLCLSKSEVPKAAILEFIKANKGK